MREAPDCVPEQCHVEVAMGIVGGRWKLAIIKVLTAGDMRYNELLRSLPGITQRMLSRQVRELEADGILVRSVVADTPPAVWYSLAPIGRELQEITFLLDAWGRSYLAEIPAVAGPPSPVGDDGPDGSAPRG